MTTPEIKAKSQEKMKKVYELMQQLEVKPEVKRKLMPSGFIEEMVVFVDMEQYPMDETPAAPEGGK